MTLDIDLDRVDRLIRDVAAAEIMPRFRRLAAHEVREKSPGSLVTIADLEAEKALTPALAALLPGSTVVGEEAVAQDALVLDRLDGEAPVWIIDPVDGTMNFTKSNPRFCVLVALVRRGQVEAGWVHDPVRGATALAAAGVGAWLVDGKDARQRLRRPEPLPLARMRGAISGRIGERGRARDIVLRSDRLGPVEGINCAGHEYLDLIEGRLDYVIFGRTWPWDHAAGVILYREAGGAVAYADGATPDEVPYSPLRRTGPLLIAPSPMRWMEIREILMTA
jgi:fructose-1,6-bisphosphatase/inositol monophosphatase family enzyme